MSRIILITTLCVMFLLAAVAVTAFVMVMLYRDDEDESLGNPIQPPEPDTMVILTQQIPPARRGSLNVLLEDPAKGKQYSLNLQKPVIVGRNANGINGLNDVGIGDSIALSRQQCCFMESEGQAYLENLSRVNATFLNNQRVEQAVPIQQGDVIQAADVVLVVAGISGAVYDHLLY